jgi:hypothetical protein
LSQLFFLPLRLVFFCVRFAHVNNVVKISGTSTNIFFTAISEDSATPTSNKIMSMFAFNNVSALTALALVNNYNFSNSRGHNNSFKLAETVRFELTAPFGTTVFKTVAINRTLPHFHNTLVRPERLELSILSALASKTSVYTNSTTSA